MNLINIDNPNIPELLIYQQLRDNAFTKDNAFIADSAKVVNLILNTDIEVKSIFATQEYYDKFSKLIETKNIPKLYVSTKEHMQSIVGHKVHHNVMLHGIRPPQTALNKLDKQIIMLDNITSSENVGSIARSAAALGIYSYLLPQQGPHPFGRRALRVSMGHTSLLKTHLYHDIKTTLQTLKSMGYSIYAAEITTNSTPLSKVKVSDQWVLLMGHEGHGISQEILDLCSEVVHIEMEANIKSFNVAVAASILMYKFKFD
ncbi:MAG: RRNA methylase family protein [uncultured Sulfurovum sp.]|uniref:rRNA methylase family protein n=1 Tax=uncultured Sulfurovum sp. TaxID=269237 RepID=A0A6S6SGX6_9BACT|nr:MAG: RRNA methylase family protein [uncultured Sulfurovum sp.]